LLTSWIAGASYATTVTKCAENTLGDCGLSVLYGLYLAQVEEGAGSKWYRISDSTFEEFPDNTARLTGTANLSNGNGFLIDLIFTGETSNPPPGSPKNTLGCFADGSLDTTDWRYYTDFTGTFIGLTGTDYEGAELNVSRVHEAFQIGIGANQQENVFGASGWFEAILEQQTSTSIVLRDTVGDINFNLVDCDGAQPPCDAESFALEQFNEVSYQNSDGTEDWSGPWVESDHGDTSSQDPSGGYVFVSSGKLKIKKNSYAAREIDLSGAISAQLSYDVKFVGDTEPEDRAVVEIRSSAGSTWTELARYEFQEDTSATHDISAHISPATEIRFRIIYDSSPGGFRGGDEFFKVDNVKVCIEPGEPSSTAVLGDFVWNDLNCDGIQDAGEPGVPGVVLNLWLDVNSNSVWEPFGPDMIVATTETDAAGIYRFDAIQVSPEGSRFFVEIAGENFEVGRPLNDFAASPVDVPDDDELDSDGDVDAHVSAQIILTSEDSQAQWDFGFCAEGDPSDCIATERCVDFELLDIEADGDNTILSFKITHNCRHALSYVAFELPGVPAIEPEDGAIYETDQHRYHVENPTQNPFYSIKFESIGEGHAQGGMDVFSYTLPTSAFSGQTSIMIQVKAATCTYAVDLNIEDCEECPPTIICPDDVALECQPGLDTSPQSTGEASATGCCEIAAITFEDTCAQECGGTERILREWTVTDACGESALCVQTIDIVDTLPPVLTVVPQDQFAECMDDVLIAEVTADDVCGAATVETNVSMSGSCPTIISVTFTATDECGNSATNGYTITVNDTTDPELVGVPDDASYECSTDVPAPAQVTATDNCDGALTPDFDEQSDGQSCPETITRTWTATDACGNSVSESQTITVNDTTDPELAGVPDDASYHCRADVPAPADVTATDNCDGALTPEFDEQSDGQSCPETITRTWLATDACGNSVSKSQTITVNDTIGPELVCGEDLVEMGDAGCLSLIPDILFTVTDNCDPDPAVTQDPATGTQVTGPGSFPVTLTAVDSCGNTTTQVCNYIVECDAALGDFVWHDFNGDGIQDPSEEGVEGVEVGLLDTGGNVLDVTMTDSNGLYIFEMLNPDDYVVQFTPPEGYVISPQLQGTDRLADSNPDPETGITDVIPLSANERDLSIDMGILVARIEAAADSVCIDDAAFVNYDVTAVGFVPTGGVRIAWLSASGDVVEELQDQPLAGQLIWPGIEFDVDGNPTNWPGWVLVGDEWVEVPDDRRPTMFIDFELNPTSTVQVTYPPATPFCNPNPPARLGDYVWLDANGDGLQDAGEEPVGDVLVNLLDDQGNVLDTTMTGPDGIYGFTVDPDTYGVEFVLPGGYSFTIPNAGGDDTVDSDADPSTGRTANVVVTAGESNLTLDAGLVCPPVITCPANVELECDINLDVSPDVTGMPTSSGCCQIVSTEFDDQLVPTCGGAYDILRAWTVTDACGQTASCTQTISVVDNGAPTLAGVPENLSLGCNVQLPQPPEVTASDLCEGDVPVQFDETSTLEGCIETTLRTWTATDGCGHSTSDSQTITRKVDTDVPVFAGVPGNVEIQCEEDFPDPPDVTATDNCDGSVLVRVNVTAQQFPCRVIFSRTWTARDGCGNTAVATQLITVADTIPPELMCEDDLTGQGDANCQALVPEIAYTVMDNCDPDVQVTQDPQAGTQVTGPGMFPITLVAQDGCGNATTQVCYFAVSCDAALGDLVWLDRNADGIQDPGEPGVYHVLVELFDARGFVLASTMTDMNGLYSFTSLDPGDYFVRFHLPEGFEVSPQTQGSDESMDSNPDPVTGDTATINLEPNEVDWTIDMGIYQPASLGDFVWEDTDGDGVQDPGEPGFPGLVVLLRDCQGLALDSTTTDENGLYFFEVTPGEYKVSFTVPAGFVLSTQNQGGDDTVDSDADPLTGMTACTEIESGEFDDTLDAGLTPRASIGDLVWEDLNGDGVQDPNEPGVDGNLVQLLDCNGNVLDTRATANGGQYLFPNLVPGQYSIRFIILAGYQFTLPDAGGDDALDSDADRSSGTTGCIELSPGESDLTVDAGLIRPGTIDLLKTVAPERITSPQDVVDYMFRVTNPFGIPITNVVLTDDLCGPVEFQSGDVNTNDILELDEAWIYTCSRTYEWDTPQDFINTAMVSGQDLIGNPVSAVDTAVVKALGINVEKSVDREVVCSGDEVTYNFIVRLLNGEPGVELRDIIVEDPQCGPVILVSGDVNNDQRLQFGEEFVYQCTTSLTQTTTNFAMDMATAWYVDPESGEETEIGPLMNEDSVVVQVVNPAIDVGLAGSVQALIPGSEATISVTVTNTGDVELTTVEVSHSAFPDCNQTAGPLTVGATVTFDCTIPQVDIEYIDDILVTASAEPGCQVVFEGEARLNLLEPDCTTIGSRVFIDGNGNGIFEDGPDTGIGDVAVQIVDVGSGTVVSSGTTTSNGVAILSLQLAGTYYVQVDETALPAGLEISGLFSNPGPNFLFDPFDEDSCATVFDFGYREICDLCGIVWFDMDAQGDTDENLSLNGINNVTVRLVPRGGTGAGDDTPPVEISTVTAGGVCERLTGNEEVPGVYRFDNVPQGEYDVVVDLSTVPADLTDFFDPMTGTVKERQSTTPVSYEYTCGQLGGNAPEPPDFGFVQEPTAILLAAFSVERTAGGTEVSWVTGVEINNLGFNLYRSESPDGEKIQINSGLVPALGSSLGGVYSLSDNSALPDATYYYWLEDVDWNLGPTLHGPVVLAAGQISSELELSGIAEDGILRIGYDELSEGGMAGEASRIAVYIDGQPVDAYVTVSEGPLGADDFVLAYVPNDLAVVDVRLKSDAPRMRETGVSFQRGPTAWRFGSATVGGAARIPLAAWRTRVIGLGFEDRNIVVLNVSDASRPRLLTGYAVIRLGDEFAIYLEHPGQRGGSIVSADQRGLRDLITEADSDGEND
jgi:hypothetical protein